MLSNLRIVLTAVAVGVLFNVTPTAATIEYYAGAYCIPRDLTDSQWKGDFAGLLYTETSVGFTGYAYCPLIHPALSFTPTEWQARIWDRNSSGCIRCRFFFHTIANGDFFGASRYSATTVGGTTTCSNPGYTGYNSLVQTIPGTATNVAQVGLECVLPASVDSAHSGVMGYRYTY